MHFLVCILGGPFASCLGIDPRNPSIDPQMTPMTPMKMNALRICVIGAICGSRPENATRFVSLPIFEWFFIQNGRFFTQNGSFSGQFMGLWKLWAIRLLVRWLAEIAADCNASHHGERVCAPAARQMAMLKCKG